MVSTALRNQFPTCSQSAELISKLLPSEAPDDPTSHFPDRSELRASYLFRSSSDYDFLAIASDRNNLSFNFSPFWRAASTKARKTALSLRKVLPIGRYFSEGA